MKRYDILDLCVRMEKVIILSIICVIFLAYYSRPSEQNNAIAYNIPDPGRDDLTTTRPCFFVDFLECTGVFNLCTDADKERLGRQAIRAIHEQMDDDKDGLIEPSESTDVRFSK